ncbi:MAG: hypothetical protein CM1200mP9_11210 [Gammaproteobacteria bacterium]|nr:MAG: hypothetical protein CM1200mP9_11210 [Gammaproteobacteria bacterium]
MQVSKIRVAPRVFFRVANNQVGGHWQFDFVGALHRIDHVSATVDLPRNPWWFEIPTTVSGLWASAV